ncbi:hypothetical protein LTR36_008748 [Oleoguttula mirabilis]|uniref:Uncharacterized protein n=1 Tax=Oleoguttula mirabilis TaxID=1507867 RepID=A0AAV9JTU4_9PEZI|nr:hypothetical protein LTR36_008748 [Oleoguttula mirabilis]
MFEAVSDFVRLLWDSEPTPPPSPQRRSPQSPQQRWYSPSPPRTPLFDPNDYLANLRPRRTRRPTAFLPNTPTQSHRPAERQIQRRGRPKAFRCPSCRCRITITPNGNPSRVFKAYEAPPAKPVVVVPEGLKPAARKGRAPGDLRRNWLKLYRR